MIDILTRSEKLKMKRELLRYSLQYFADIIGCSKQTLSDLEKGPRKRSEMSLNFYEIVMSRHDDEIKKKIAEEIKKLNSLYED